MEDNPRFHHRKDKTSTLHTVGAVVLEETVLGFHDAIMVVAVEEEPVFLLCSRCGPGRL